MEFVLQRLQQECVIDDDIFDRVLKLIYVTNQPDYEPEAA